MRDGGRRQCDVMWRGLPGASGGAGDDALRRSSALEDGTPLFLEGLDAFLEIFAGADLVEDAADAGNAFEGAFGHGLVGEAFQGLDDEGGVGCDRGGEFLGGGNVLAGRGETVDEADLVGAGAVSSLPARRNSIAILWGMRAMRDEMPPAVVPILASG